MREGYLRGEAKKKRISLAAARANRFKIDWASYEPTDARRCSAPRRMLDYPLAELVAYIDWSPFFSTWELRGRYPAILDDKIVGVEAQEAARRRAGDAEAHGRRSTGSPPMPSSGSGRPTPSATTSRSTTDATAKRRIATLHTLRQQIARDASNERAQTALADFVAPKETGRADYIGAFAVTTGIGEEEALERHLAKTDDYGRIMLKALADRLAEALAERLHQRVRREFWGYARDERLSQRGSDRGEVSRHPARARAIPHNPITPRRGRSSGCSMRRRWPASS